MANEKSAKRTPTRSGSMQRSKQLRLPAAFFCLIVLFPVAFAQDAAPTPPSSNSGTDNGTAAAAPASAGQNTPLQQVPPDQLPAGQSPAAQPQAAQPAAAQPQEAQPQAAQSPANDQIEPANDQSGMFVFKKQIEEVVLHATVTNEQRQLVPGLDKSAFTVVDNGTPQTITSFRREDVPVALGIVIDNSASMRDKRGKINQAVLNLIRASNAQDAVFVVNFSDNPYLDQDFTSNVNLLQAALHQVSLKGSTALYDAVVASSVHLNKAPLEKKVLLVITDGQDNMSRETLEEASRRLQKANGPTLYAIGLLGNGLQRSGREALQSLAERTGGVAYFPETLDQVDDITRTVAHDIRSQYMIAYRPHNQNVKPEYQSVQVEAHAPGYGKLTVRTKTGYYPPSR